MEGLVEAKRRTQCKKEGTQISQPDKAGSVRVVVGPHLPKFLLHSGVEEARVLDLCLLISLNDDCNEKLEEDKCHKEGEAEEVYNS